MNIETWQRHNGDYLAVSLRWLRLRFQRLIATQPAVQTVKVGLFGLKQRSEATLRTVAERDPTLEQDLLAVARERATLAARMPPPALVLLAERFRLSEFERDCLLLCAAAELDPNLPQWCAQVPENQGRAYPTFALALTLFDEPSWDALSGQRPLRYAHLVELNQTGATPLTAAALRADERVVNFIKGLNVLDDRLALLLHAVGGAGTMRLADSQRPTVDAILDQFQHRAADAGPPVVQLIGTDCGSKLAVAAETCAALSRQLFRLEVSDLPANVGELETLARLWQRETLLLPVALYIDADRFDPTAPDATTALHRFLSRPVGVVFIGVREAPLALRGPTFPTEVAKPTASEQRTAWATHARPHLAPDAADDAARRLAGQFDLNLDDIATATELALGAAEAPTEAAERLWDACRQLTRPRLDALAPRLNAKATWDDLVVPDETRSLLRQIGGQVRERHRVYDDWGFARRMNRGLGISALFAGPSGTGKTMAAEVLANDLQLNLYRIDLSAVVSKYIGETEKNLCKLFDAAEQGGVVLFFDEADALFGKRSEVKDSHDRYANIEINYLLQRMETFNGLAILATNMKSALDPAFVRRLRFIVDFPFPSLADRRRIWEQALPAETPHDALDYEQLVKLNLSGAHIHRIALNAAFAAAQNGQSVTMPTLIAAARTELRRIEKPFNEAEFR